MPDLSLSPGAWNTEPPEGSTRGPAQIASPWSLTIPRAPKVVGYVTNSGEDTKNVSKLRLEYEITGSGTLVAADGGSPARVALFIQGVGDNYQGGNQNDPNDPAQYKYRWWSVDRQPLTVPTAGIMVHEVALTPDKWLSVWGRKGDLNAASLAGFTNLKNRPDNKVGFTFGANTAGHGISTNGTIYFKLRKFSLI